MFLIFGYFIHFSKPIIYLKKFNQQSGIHFAVPFVNAMAHIKNIWVCHLLVYIYLENISLLISFLRSASPVLSCLTPPCSPPLRFSRELRAMEGGEGGGNLSSACPSDRGVRPLREGLLFKRLSLHLFSQQNFTAVLQKSKEYKSLPFKRKGGQTAIRHKVWFQKGQFSFDIRSFPPFVTAKEDGILNFPSQNSCSHTLTLGENKLLNHTNPTSPAKYGTIVSDLASNGVPKWFRVVELIGWMNDSMIHS